MEQILFFIRILIINQTTSDFVLIFVKWLNSMLLKYLFKPQPNFIYNQLLRRHHDSPT